MAEGKNLVNRYMDDCRSIDPTAMYYIRSFIKNFREMSEDTVRDTIWHDLWVNNYRFNNEHLQSQILNRATMLNAKNGIFAKVTSVQDAVTASESSV